MKVYKINLNLQDLKTNKFDFSQSGNDFEINIYENYSDTQMYIDIYYANEKKWLCLGQKMTPNMSLLQCVEYKLEKQTTKFNFILGHKDYAFQKNDTFFEELNSENTCLFYGEW